MIFFIFFGFWGFFWIFGIFTDLFPEFFGCTKILLMKKDLNTEIEGLFTPKQDVRILNPQKNPYFYWIFFRFFGFLEFFFCVLGFKKKWFKHWIQGFVHSQIRDTDFKFSKKILGFFGFFFLDFSNFFGFFLSEQPLGRLLPLLQVEIA